jgi:hypothetical protein
MENKKPDQKISIVVDSIFTLGKNKGVADLADKSSYLYKDGAICMCPFMSSVGMDWATKGHGLLPFSCGSFCQHFHIKRDTKKIIEKSDPNGMEVEKIVATGKLKVGLSCGSSGVWFDIAGVVLNEATPESSAPQSNLRVTKGAEEEPKA